MTVTTNTQPQAGNGLQRRAFEPTQQARHLEWDEDGTPLSTSSVVYLFRSIDADFPLWDRIKTRERLELVQSAPERFELWTLFTIPVDDLVRAPTAAIADALHRLDRIEAAAAKAISGMREVAREMAVKP